MSDAGRDEPTSPMVRHPCARLPSAAVQAGCSQKRAVARVQDDDSESEGRSESRSESKGVEEEVEDEVCASAKPALTPCPLSAAALCCTPAPMLRPVLSARKRPGSLTRGASHLHIVVPGHKPGVRSPALPVTPSCSRIPSVDTVSPGGVYACRVRALLCCAPAPGTGSLCSRKNCSPDPCPA